MSKTKARAKQGEGSLLKRGKKGYYYLRHYVEKKQVLTRLIDNVGDPITNQRLAEKARNDLLAPLSLSDKAERIKALQAKLDGVTQQQAAAEDKRGPSIPLSRMWVDYYGSKNRPESGDSTMNRYQSTVAAFNKWMGKTYPKIGNMKEVTVAHAEAYAHYLDGKNLSPSSFNIYLNNLAMVWSVLAEKAGLKSNPFAWDKKTRTGIQRKNVKAQSALRKKRALTMDEVNEVMKKADGDYKTLLIILLCTGQRLVDCVKLQWKAIDFDAGIITIIPQKTANRTGKEVFIPILPQLREELGGMKKTGRYLLPKLVEVYDRDRSAITKKIRAIFTDAKLNAHRDTGLPTDQAIVETGAHSCRHSFVTIARLAGIPDAVIQTITGHSSIEMVDHYTAITADTVKQLAAAMPSGLIGTQNLLTEPEQKDEIVPPWILEKLKRANKQNAMQIIAELIEGAA